MTISNADVFKSLSIAYIRVQDQTDDSSKDCTYELICDHTGQLVSHRRLTSDEYTSLLNNIELSHEPIPYLRTELAIYAHTAWSGWMQYMFSKCAAQPDGTLIVPAWAVTRWSRQLATPYHMLPTDEQASDLDEADKILQIVANVPIP